MSKRDVIYISEDVADISVNYFPVSSTLQSFFRKEKIKLVGDLRKIQPDNIEQILRNKKKPFSELKQLIISIQDNNSEEIIFAEEDIFDGIKGDNQPFEQEDENFTEEIQPILSINGLLEFINDFVTGLKGQDKEIFLGRLGATPDEKVIPMTKICEKFKLSPDFVGQTLAAWTNEIKSDIGQDGRRVLNKLYNNCVESVCPLTEQFLIYLTNNDFNLFQHPPVFYIRLINRLSPDIPVLPEYKNKLKYLEKDALMVSKQIKKLLLEAYVPAPLPEVFSRVMVSDTIEKDFVRAFFEAIKSVKFNLIKTDDPKAVYIELSGKIVP